MNEIQDFWSVECAEGEPDLFVCMGCLSEVYRAKVPIPACPSCGAVSAFEAFTLDAIVDWGSEDLVQKAKEAAKEQATGATPVHREFPQTDSASQPAQ